MTIREAIAGSGLERADAEILLSHLLQWHRAWILAHDNELLSDTVLDAFTSLAKRRANREPIAYITGEKEFFRHVFHVTPDVLIPRPATELLVEHALAVLHKAKAQSSIREIDTDIVAWTEVKHPAVGAHTVVDVGTGSGCIAITMALEEAQQRTTITRHQRLEARRFQRRIGRGRLAGPVGRIGVRARATEGQNAHLILADRYRPQ